MMENPKSRTLLIVEHQAITREALANVFRSEGYHVVTAADSQEALNYLRGPAPPSVVLLDLREASGDSSGFLETRQRDEFLASIPLVIMTEGPVDAKWLAAPKVAGSFRKPVPIDPLLSLVRQVE